MKFLSVLIAVAFSFPVMAGEDYGMAKYFWNIYYKMTCDANIEKRLEELSSIIPEGNA